MIKGLHLDPAATAIAILGGTGTVSKITGIDRSQVWRWMQPRNKGGTGGLIPPEHQRKMLEYAEKHKKPLTAEMIIRGSKAA